MSDDLAVIKRVIEGDVESFRLLVQRYERPLFCLVRNLLPGPQDCDDIGQEVFLAAYRNLAAYDPRRSAFSTWLFTIARHKCWNALKKKKPVALPEVPEAADLRTPEGEAAGEELYRQLDAALDALPFEQKTAFVLAEIQGLSHEEIGRIEGVKPGTVKSRLSRARDKLRVLLRRTVEFP
jgi:RNA polymerase sigma-70 factor (ECF subfamily)